MFTPSEFKTPFIRKEQLAKDAYGFYFEKPESFSFSPGQYVRVTLDIQNPDERGNSHFFSLAISPSAKEIRIVTRIVQSTFKNTLAALTPGNLVQFFGPVGRFTFDETTPRPHVLLAGGIGITPFLSMVPYAVEKKFSEKISLFASFSTTEDLILHDELSQIVRDSPNIKIIYTVTKPQPGAGSIWKGETGRISKEMIEKYVQDIQKRLYSIAGPPAMVSAMEELVTQMGIASEQIRKESFSGY